ncbi:MAG: DUF86 domain-containing protein [Deltaproteobacteria bacterium]|nr:DUF86 domain-containing protein [Deltaproteobacteria bacterium]
MPRDFKVYLQDILLAIEKINKYKLGLSFEELMEDEKTIDAVIRNLEIIGEAVRNIPRHIREQYQDIEWEKISSLRNILIHEYFAIQMKIIWEIIENKLPILEIQIRKIVQCK